METVDFLRRIWPDKGAYCLAKKETKGFTHAWFSDIEAVTKVVAHLDDRHETVYMGCATFDDSKSRRVTRPLCSGILA